MAGRSSTTFQKRQKELARQEKQKDKAAKRAERRVEQDKSGPRNLDDDIDYSLAYRPDVELEVLDEESIPITPKQ
jgi:hypothetical protein